MKSLALQGIKNFHLLAMLFLFFFYTSNAKSETESVLLIERFEKVYLEVSSDEQEQPLRELLAEAERNRDQNKEDAEAWIASGMIRSAYGATQGIRALGILKTARRDFETAIDLNDRALGGLAQAFLGRLYFILPSWPLSFGSSKKARALLEEALDIDSESMANNYYYGLFLASEDEYQEALSYLARAKSAARRPNLPNWDAVLLRDIDLAIQSVNEYQ